MKKFLALCMAAQVFLSPILANAYDLTREVPKKNPRVTSLALIPFTETRSPSFDHMMNQIEGDLRGLKGVKVLDRSKTDSILDYYVKYVNKTATDTGAERSLTDARQALLEGTNQNALKLLDATERKIKERVAGGGSNEGLYQIYLLRAKIDRSNGNQAGVQKEYEKLAQSAPEFQLDPNLFSNWERSAFKSAKDKIASQGKGAIEVVATPEGSEVFLNGIHLGITPMTLENLPAGDHIVEVKTVNHDAFLQRVHLSNGQKSVIKSSLIRTGIASNAVANSIKPSLYKTDLEISKLISTLGYHLGVDKVVLVADKKEAGKDSVVYRLVDTKLGAVQKQHEVAISSAQPKDGIALLVNSIHQDARVDILKNPSKYADPSVGSVVLHQKRKPLYKKPLFWVLVGAAAGTGGALAAILGGGAAATTGGVLIGF